MRKIIVMLIIAGIFLWSTAVHAALVFNADFARDGVYENAWPLMAGQVVSVDIYVSGVPAPGLISMGFKLEYDADKIEVVAAAVDQINWPIDFLKTDIPGEIEMTGTFVPGPSENEGRKGDHIRLGTITLRCVSDGMSVLNLQDREGDWFVLFDEDGGYPIVLDGDIGTGILVATIRPPVLGDVNGDGSVDLADAVLTLRKMALIHEGYLHANADCSGDGVIGIEEAIYILQKISFLR